MTALIDSLICVKTTTFVTVTVSAAAVAFIAAFAVTYLACKLRYRSTRSLRAECEKMSYVLDNISQCIIAIDRNAVIKILNLSAAKLLGVSQNLVGRDIYFAVSDVSLLNKIYESLKDDTDRFEYHAGDKFLAVNICRPPATDVYEDITEIIIITDVTPERLAAKQRSDFFSNAGHELKTPLTSIQGLTELMLVKAEQGTTTYKHAERIHKEAARLSTLVLDMLKLSNIENLHSTPMTSENRVEIDLSEVVAEVISSLEPEARKKDVTTTVSGGGRVVAEHKHVYEIVSNLYSNALNYNKQGGRISVDIAETDQKTVLTVADSGIGIAKDHIPRLCERFYRVDKSRSKKTGGTGLGLAIVKHVCVLYGAELNIESTEDVGTTVSVAFPKIKE